jgi:hypothetical protein
MMGDKWDYSGKKIFLHRPNLIIFVFIHRLQDLNISDKSNNLLAHVNIILTLINIKS